MKGNAQLGIAVVIAGVVVAFIGVLIWTGALSWFGRLPGDIRATGEHTRVYVPITSMLILSVLLSLILYLIRRFFF